MTDNSQHRAVVAALAERTHQDHTFGKQNHDPAYWLAILGKQVGQVGEEVLNLKWSDKPDPSTLYHELTQVVAVGLAFMECIDERRLGNDIRTVRPRSKRHLARALGRDEEDMLKDSPTPAPWENRAKPVVLPAGEDYFTEESIHD